MKSKFYVTIIAKNITISSHKGKGSPIWGWKCLDFIYFLVYEAYK